MADFMLRRPGMPRANEMNSVETISQLRISSTLALEEVLT
jgi:hypothetical protein